MGLRRLLTPTQAPRPEKNTYGDLNFVQQYSGSSSSNLNGSAPNKILPMVEKAKVSSDIQYVDEIRLVLRHN